VAEASSAKPGWVVLALVDWQRLGERRHDRRSRSLDLEAGLISQSSV
jgi:hypothetical protein